MRPSFSLLRSVTLFTKPHCVLCLYAKEAVKQASSQIQFSYREVDISDPANKRWFEEYQYDIPVVHVNQSEPLSSSPGSDTTKNHDAKISKTGTSSGSSDPKVFMHRIKPEQIVDALQKKEC